jgi:hypothetical protein
MAMDPRGFRGAVPREAVLWPFAALKCPSVPTSVQEVSKRAVELGARVERAEEKFQESFGEGELAELRRRINAALLVLRYPQNRERLAASMKEHGVKCPAVPSVPRARMSVVEWLLRRWLKDYGRGGE